VVDSLRDGGIRGNTGVCDYTRPWELVLLRSFEMGRLVARRSLPIFGWQGLLAEKTHFGIPEGWPGEAFARWARAMKLDAARRIRHIHSI
jgi:hypothetical protein